MKMKPISEIKILVVGDIMLDKYVVGSVDRISPEAPVPVINVMNEYYTPGGCGNVIRNLQTLGIAVTCISQIGNDSMGDLLLSLISDNNFTSCIFKSDTIPTTIKERIIADYRQTQMLRIDREKHSYLDIDNIEFPKEEFDVIIISDYNKGVVTSNLMYHLKSTYPNTKIIVDPKPVNSTLYNDVFMLTPNAKEFKEMEEGYFPCNVEYIIKTLGKDGMMVYSSFYHNLSHKIPSIPVDVFNVTGCGDTVIAIISACITMGFNITASAKIANGCAGYVASVPGTTTVPLEVFNHQIEIHTCS